jgi:hypothetical protein
MAKGERDLPKLTAEQVHAHERFVWMEITMKELQRACRVLREAEQFGPVVDIVFQRAVQLTMSDGEFTP